MANEEVPATDVPQAAVVADEDLYRAYQFKLLIDGVTKGHFTRCSGLGVRVVPIAYREGGDVQIVRQLPGPVQYSEVTLSYGLIKADSEAIWQWLMSGVSGMADRKNVSIVVLGAGGSGEKVRWNLLSTWPTGWRGGELDAMSRDLVIEQITLVYESLTRL